MPELAPAGAGARHAGLRAAVATRARGRRHGDRRRAADRSPERASAMRSAARPGTTPGRAGSAATATSTTPPWRRRRCAKAGVARVGDPRPRPALPQRHVGAASSGCATTSLHSLHGATGANLPWRRVRARSEREHLVAFRRPPTADAYLDAVAALARHARAASADAIVLSLGYDTVAGDPHGSWGFDAADLRRGSAACSPLRAARVRGPRGRLCARLARGCSHAFATGLLGARGRDDEHAERPADERASGLSAAPRRDRRGDRAACSASASRSAAKSRCYKREHEIPMMQPGRVAEVRARYLARGAEAGCRPSSPPACSSC